MSIRTRFHPNNDGTFTIQRRQDVEPTIEWNKVLRSRPQTQTDGLKHIASIPPIFIEKMMNESGVPFFSLPSYEMAKLVKKLLDNPDYAFLKTTEKGTKWR
jgi:hypothetical protein